MHQVRLAGNDSINDQIHSCLATLDQRDVDPFVKKFRRGTDEQNFHTYRELLLGSHLRQRGWDVRYEQSIHGKTPDWLLPTHGDEVKEIVDVVTLHQRRSIDIEIRDFVSKGQAWSGWITNPPNRIFSKLDKKLGAYRNLARYQRLPYTVAAFGEFTASLGPEEISHVLYEHDGGLFKDAPELSGVIFFRESNGNYEFNYFKNPQAAIPSRFYGSTVGRTRLQPSE